ADAVIVDRETESAHPQARQVLERGGDVANRLRLGDLESHPVRLESLAADDLRDGFGIIRIGKRSRRDVDRNRQVQTGTAPASGFECRECENDPRELVEIAGAGKRRQEPLRAEQTVSWMTPAGEERGADDAPRREIDFRLEEGFELTGRYSREDLLGLERKRLVERALDDRVVRNIVAENGEKLVARHGLAD